MPSPEDDRPAVTVEEIDKARQLGPAGYRFWCDREGLTPLQLGEDTFIAGMTFALGVRRTHPSIFDSKSN